MIAQLSSFIVHLIQYLGYGGIFALMTLESAFIPIPSEVTMSFAGFLVSEGALSFPLVVLAGTLGNVFGSVISYYIGEFLHKRGLRRVIQRYGKYLLVDEDDYERSSKWFEKYGSGIVFVSRLLPGVRTYISLPAGVSKMRMWKFILYTFAGSLIWSALLTWIGMYLGSNWDTLGPIFNKFQYAIAALIILAIAFFVFKRVGRNKR